MGRPVVTAMGALTAGAVAGLAGGTALLARQSSAHLQAQYLPAAGRELVAAPDFTLNDQNGKPISLHSFAGHTVLVTFLDPLCTEGCPIAGRELAAIEAKLDTAPTLLVVSVAPDRTAADVEHFTAPLNWRPGWHWLLGTQAELAPVWAAYHIAVQATAHDVLHDQSLEIINPQSQIRAEYAAPLPIDEVTRLIQTTQHSEVRT